MATAPKEQGSLAWRRNAAAAALLAYVAIAGQDGGIVAWPLLLVVAVAAVFGLRRRTVMAQVLSQGVACFCLVDPAVRVVRQLFDLSGIVEPYGALTAASLAAGAAVVLAAGAAVVLARPALHTTEAQRAFAPVAYRGWFLAGAIASVTAAMTAASLALTALFWGSHWAPVCIAVTFGFLASAIGVVRMRAWGVLLGGLTAIAATVATLVSDSYEATAIVLALAATPGAILGLPLLASRLGRGAGVRAVVADPPRMRVAADRTDAAGNGQEPDETLLEPTQEKSPIRSVAQELPP